jgi:putative ABC transport system permease protein
MHAVRDHERTTAPLSDGVLRSALVVAQVTLAIVLLVGVGLLARSFVKLHQTRLGIDPGNVWTFQIDLPEPRYGDPARRVAFYQEYQDRLEAVAGVKAVGAISWLPVSGEYNNWGFRYLTSQGDAVWRSANFRIVEGSYYEALGIRQISGRAFARTDNAGTPPVAVVNESFVRQYYDHRDPLTEEFVAEGLRWRVVGVVSDVAHDHRGDVVPTVYLPHSQFAYDRNWALTQLIATTTRRSDILELARRDLAAMDPDLVLYDPRSMRDVTGAAIARETFAFVLMCVFGTLALSLAAAGIYGVLAYSVSRRTREIGIRMALGANRRTVRRAVVRQGTLLSAVGILAGLTGAFALSRVLESMLFEVDVRDPITFAAVPIAVALVAWLAAFLPARRASRVDPLEAIRYE